MSKNSMVVAAYITKLEAMHTNKNTVQYNVIVTFEVNREDEYAYFPEQIAAERSKFLLGLYRFEPETSKSEASQADTSQRLIDTTVIE